MTGKTLAKTLTTNGVKVLKSYEWTDVTDAGVDLAGDLSVQIADRLMLLNRWDESEQCIYHLGHFTSVNALVAAIRGVTTAVRPVSCN